MRVGDVRRMRHRLKCLGVLELEVWCAGLEDALQTHDAAILQAVDAFLSLEVPDMLAMMEGVLPRPVLLTPWLKCRV